MKTIIKKMRPFDFIFIVLVVILSFVPAVVMAYHLNGNTGGGQAVAEIKIDGEVVDRYPLTPGQSVEKKYIPGKNQYNIIEVKDQKVRIKEDNSPDQIGVRTGWISRPGQTAVCLPHHFVIEIAGERQSDDLILPLP
ncbi:MAG: NusG domain II-containing protein [Aerococcus sp.]|nr:NusG domain II-containing protein [Aerococcus sp.]